MSLEEVKAAVEKVKTFKTDYEKLIKEVFSQAVKEVLVNYPEVKKLIYVGYTPGFNDGDPCYHSQDLYLNVQEGYEEEEDEDGNPIEYVPVPHEVAKEVYDILSPLEDVVEMMYGTDFKVTYSLVNGEIECEHEDYDCGY